MLIIAPFVVTALGAPIMVHVDPIQLHLDQTLLAPSAVHPFGTDNFGRDVFARVIYGSALDLQIGIFSVIPAFLIGTTLGAVAAYFGGWLDAALMRLVDIIIAFPFLVLVIAIVAALGSGIKNMYVAVALVGWISYARLVRSEVMVALQQDYVSAARVLGYGHARILIRHLLPNVTVQPIILSTTNFVAFILLGSALGYLGLGVPPPAPEWGVMIAEGRDFLAIAPWMSLFPGLAIGILGAGFLILGDGLADLLRPEVAR